MLSGNVTIEAVAYELAPHRVTSAELEDQIAGTMARLNIPMGQIETMTGIRERRFWDATMMPSDAATMAARKVIAQAGIDPQDIGCLINTSVSKDYLEPSVACFVHGNLGLSPSCINYDISNACLGFLNAMHTISMMIESGTIKYGLIVDGESSRYVVESTIDRLKQPTTTRQDYKDNFATLTLGSGAAAMLLTHRSLSRTGHLINGLVNLADTVHNRLCLGQPDQMITKGLQLLVAGRDLAVNTWKVASHSFRYWCDEKIDLYVPHQVGARHMSVINQALGITPEKVHLNLYTQGNIGPAAIPITLAMAEEDGRLHPDAHVALLGIGSGLNCSMMSLNW